MSEGRDQPPRPPARRPRRRRWLLTTLLLLLALPFLIVALLALGLRSEGLRRALLAEASARLETAAGLRLEAEDFHLALLDGRLEVEGLRLYASGEAAGDDTPPFLRVPLAVAEIQWRSLLGGHPVLRELGLEGPALDLGAPLPAAEETPEEEPLRPLPLDVLTLRLSSGEVRGTPPPENGGWLETWRLEGLEVRGAYRGGEADLELEAGTLRTSLEGGREHVAQLEAALAGRIEDVLVLERLHLEGEGLRLELEGRGDLEGERPLQGRLELDAEPAVFLPGPGDGSRLRLAGRIDDLRRLLGEVEIDVRDLPAELLEPWLGAETMARMGAADSHLDLDATVEGPSGAPFTGHGELSWSSPERELLAVSFRADLERAGADALDELDLRTLDARAEVRGDELPLDLLEPWLGLEGLQRTGAGGGRIDLAATLEATPWAAPEDAAEVTAEAAAGRYRAEAEVVWKRGDERLLEAAGRATAERAADGLAFVEASLEGDVTARAEGLPAGALEPWLASGELERFGARGTSLDLDAEARLKEGWPGPLDARADVTWRDGEQVLARAEARALPPRGGSPVRLALDAELLPASPGRRALGGSVTAPSWDTISEGRLEAGRVELELPDLAAAYAELRGRWGELVPAAEASWPGAPLRGSLRADLEASGPLESPEARLEADWRIDGGAVRLRFDGRPLEQRGDGLLELEAFDLALLDPLLSGDPHAAEDSAETEAGLGGVVSGTLEVAGSLEEPRASLALDGRDLTYGEALPRLEEARLEARLDGDLLEIDTLRATAGERMLTARGRAVLADPLVDARLEAELSRPQPELEELRASAELDGGVLRLRLRVPPELGEGELGMRLPLGALAAFPELAESLEGLPLVLAEGPASLEVDVARLDLSPYLRQLEGEGMPRRASAAIRGQLSVDPSDPTAARGELEVAGLEVATDEHRLSTAVPLRLRIGDRRLELERLPLEIDDRRFEMVGRVGLAGGWRLGDPPADAVEAITFDAGGTLEASVFNPYLVGGAAAGPFRLEIQTRGPLDALEVEAVLDGPEASIAYLRPYATRLVAPQVEITTEGDTLVLRSARAELNEGTIELEGSLTTGGDLDLRAVLGNVRYRLDYGLSTLLSGNLRLQLPAEGRGLISGNLLLERAVVRRNLDIDQLLLSQLFSPPELTGTAETTTLDRIRLDLSLGNLDGLRINNNLGRLRAQWDELEIRGTLAEPIVRGRVDAEPGGLIFAYGQALRVDDATLTFPGQPGVPPDLDLETTSSLEDPTIARGGGLGEGAWNPYSDPYARQDIGRLGTGGGDEERGEISGNITGGLASYFGNELSSKLGGALSRTRFSYSYRPTLVFFEEDPSARLTVSQDLSTHVLLAVSIDLRESQNQTYILDLHGFQPFPSVSAQLFTNDEDNAGATLQQTLSYGGGAVEDDGAPRLRKLVAEPPEDISKRGLRRAAGFEKGEAMPFDAEFDVEVDVTDYLRRRGYPEAEVDAELEEVGRERVDLVLEIDPGPRARFVFEGTEPPKAARSSITSLYRSDFYQEASLEEMRAQTVLALRSEGHLEPEVSVEVSFDRPGDPASPRTVTIRSAGGREVELDELVFEGIDADVASELSGRFGGTVERVELAAGVPSADERLLGALRSLGFPEAEIAARRTSDDGETLTVVLEPGRRQVLTAVRVEGLEELDEREWNELVLLEAGDPLRGDRVGASALRLQDELEALGFADAKVRPVLSETRPEDPYELELSFRVEPGPRYVVDDVEIRGLRKTRPGFVRRTAGIETGEHLDDEELAAGRRRLFDLGLFQRVTTDSEHQGEMATVVFDLEEKPRFFVSYGLRWESGEGFGAVVDAVDRNFLGRAVTLGVRAFYRSDDESARFYSALPRVFGGRSSLELYVEGRDKTETIDDVTFTTHSTEATLQLTTPFSDHLTGRVYGRYRSEHIFEPDPLDPLFAFDQTTTSPFLGWQVFYDRRNDEVRASRGYFLSADLSASFPEIGSDFEYLRFFGQANLFRTIARLGSRPVVWAQSFRLGWLEPFESAILPSVGFLTGGEYSVRGYASESIGREGVLVGEPVGGEALLVLNQELRIPIWGDISGVVFFDAGNAWASSDDFGSDLFKGAGLGVRAGTPFGLLRLDAAVPLDQREQDDDLKLYFGFGNTF